MYRSKAILALLLMLSLLSCNGKGFDFACSRVVVISNGDKESSAGADYFYNHINRRVLEHSTVSFARTDNTLEFSDAIVYFELVPDLEVDYEIVNETNKISFFAKNRKTLNWLSYMLINQFSEYHAIEVADLPPNYIQFDTGKYNFSLQYRDPHLQPNMNSDMSGVLNTHNVDVDWGLWGHNLGRVFVDGTSTSSQALVDGRRDKDQFCFSAESTFDAVSDFILDQYGRGNNVGLWFMISPNDNDKVCTCDACLKLGNTSANASPAVVDLLNKLALQYPNHHFYTTAYRTTKKAPKIRLEPNTGVLFSTVDLSKSPELSATSAQIFVKELEAWRENSSTIYLWDYISNFDEYLTPYPVLYRFQRQLRFFKEQDVDGIFLNGSGYDYSPFDDIKTYVLSALMIDQNLSVDSLVINYTKRFYPISGELISKYYLNLERQSFNNNLDIGIYTPFRNARRTYFDLKKFNSFYNELLLKSSKLTGAERDKVEVLLASLSFVKLQIAYHDGALDNHIYVLEKGSMKLGKDAKAAEWRLRKAVKDGYLTSYKEEGGDLNKYLDSWQAQEQTKYVSNKVHAVSVRGEQTKEYYVDAGLLNDNKKGFTSDFNQGWFLIGEDALLSCDLGEKGMSKDISGIVLKFLINERHRMLPPERIEIFVGGKLLKEYSKDDLNYQENLAVLDKNIKLSVDQPIEIRIVKNRKLKKSVIACDEIQIF